MPNPVESFSLPRRMGTLVRYTKTGPWTWSHWDRRLQKRRYEATKKVNRSKAEQWVYQQVATRSEERFRYQGIRILFSTVAEEYSEARKVGREFSRLRQSSLLKLKGATNAFKEYCADAYESLAIDQIDSDLLQGFVDVEAGRISTEAANRNLACILKILKFAHARHYILRVPSARQVFDPRLPEDRDENNTGIGGWPCPTPEQVRLILAHAGPKIVATGETAFNGSEQGRPVYRGINMNDYTDLFATLCLSGMRLGEALYLTWADVDLVNKVILIRPGIKNGKHWTPKTKLSIRRIPMHPDLETILHGLKRTNRKDQWVFETRRGTQMQASNVEKRMREICEELGFEEHYVPHSFRKYWASTVSQQDFDWRLMIKTFGHGDFELILSTYYAQNDDARLVAEINKVDFGLRVPRSA